MGLSLKHQLRVAVAQMAREATFNPHHRVHRHLRRATLIIGALGFRRLPFHAELVERLMRHTGEAIAAIQHDGISDRRLLDQGRCHFALVVEWAS
jgi:hypothetical protein